VHEAEPFRNLGEQYTSTHSLTVRIVRRI